MPCGENHFANGDATSSVKIDGRNILDDPPGLNELSIDVQTRPILRLHRDSTFGLRPPA